MSAQQTPSEPRHRLKRLLAPRHIAFIGGRSLATALDACQDLGFAGDIWVVHPALEEVAGHSCFPSVSALPAPPDAAFVGVRRALAIDAIGELASAGAGGAVCLAAGFAELGEGGRVWQRRLIEAAGSMPVIGPNCYGLLNYLDGVALWPDIHGGRRLERGVALISQSGNISLNASMADRSVGFSHIISIGNQAVVTAGECIEAMLDDPRVRAIGLYLEGIVDEPLLRQAAYRAASLGVPVVAIKAGHTEVARRTAANHTGSDVGAPDDTQLLFDALGIARVATLPELLETLKLQAAWGDRGGPSLLLLTASGGDSALVADLALEAGLRFPPLSPEGAMRLSEQLGDLVAIANPLDYNTVVWGDRAALETCFLTTMQETVDAVVLVLDHPREGTGDAAPWEIAVDAFVAAHQQTGRPAVVLSTLPESLPKATRDRLLRCGVVPLQGVREAVAALSAGAYGQMRRAHIRDLTDANMEGPA